MSCGTLRDRFYVRDECPPGVQCPVEPLVIGVCPVGTGVQCPVRDRFYVSDECPPGVQCPVKPLGIGSTLVMSVPLGYSVLWNP